MAAQTHRVFDNLERALRDAGLTMGDVIKCNVYLTDMANFPALNVAYGARFESPYPARTTVAVAGLPLGAQVEIELVARRGGDGGDVGREVLVEHYALTSLQRRITCQQCLRGEFDDDDRVFAYHAVRVQKFWTACFIAAAAQFRAGIAVSTKGSAVVPRALLPAPASMIVSDIYKR